MESISQRNLRFCRLYFFLLFAIPQLFHPLKMLTYQTKNFTSWIMFFLYFIFWQRIQNKGKSIDKWDHAKLYRICHKWNCRHKQNESWMLWYKNQPKRKVIKYDLFVAAIKCQFLKSGMWISSKEFCMCIAFSGFEIGMF